MFGFLAGVRLRCIRNNCISNNHGEIFEFWAGGRSDPMWLFLVENGLWSFLGWFDVCLDDNAVIMRDEVIEVSELIVRWTPWACISTCIFLSLNPLVSRSSWNE